jgi:UDP-GlcNAc3NAcA epimerase
MYDTFLAARKRVLANRSLSGTQLVNDNPGRSGLMTLHREETTRDVSRLIELLAAVNSLGFRIDFPAHPRTRASLLHSGSALSDFNNVRIIDPIGYIDLVDKLMSADVVLTDSGGLQKEAYWCGVPCVTLMSETTWMETVNEGWNRLIGLEPNSVGGAVDEALNSKPDDLTPRVAYGAAGAARRIAAELGWI